MSNKIQGLKSRIRDLPGMQVGSELSFRSPSRTEIAIERMTAEKVPAKVYGFMWNDCVHESSYELMSLHLTKAGAWRAMRAHLWEWAMQQREDSLRSGYDFTHRHSQAWNVREYEVQA